MTAPVRPGGPCKDKPFKRDSTSNPTLPSSPARRLRLRKFLGGGKEIGGELQRQIWGSAHSPVVGCMTLGFLFIFSASRMDCLLPIALVASASGSSYPSMSFKSGQMITRRREPDHHPQTPCMTKLGTKGACSISRAERGLRLDTTMSWRQENGTHLSLLPEPKRALEDSHAISPAAGCHTESGTNEHHRTPKEGGERGRDSWVWIQGTRLGQTCLRICPSNFRFSVSATPTSD